MDSMAQESVTFTSQAWANYERMINNPQTLLGYTKDIKQYIAFRKVDDPAKILVGEAVEMENNIIEFIMYKKEKGISVPRIRRIIAALKLFHVSNRISLNWPYVLRHIGRAKTKKDKAYSHEQINKALAICEPREKALILLYASSGVRRGGLCEERDKKGKVVYRGLQLKHLEPIDKYGIYKITVYEGDEEEYRTYCTPEARMAIDDYIAYRRRFGEDITPESILIRDDFDRDDPIRVKSPKSLKEDSLTVLITEVMEKAGVRTKVTLTENMVRGRIRHEIKAVHGLRKFWDTQMTLAGVSPLWTELLEGHKIKGMKHHYLRPTDEELLEGNDRMRGYVDTFEYLTISEENRLKKENRQLKQNVALKDEVLLKATEALNRLGVDTTNITNRNTL